MKSNNLKSVKSKMRGIGGGIKSRREGKDRTGTNHVWPFILVVSQVGVGSPLQKAAGADNPWSLHAPLYK